MPRLSIPQKARSRTHTFSAYNEEWRALLRLTLKMKLHSPFDVVRHAIAQSPHQAIISERQHGNFRDPRFASKRTMDRRKAA